MTMTSRRLLYRFIRLLIVWEQDPDWYQQYVVDITLRTLKLKTCTDLHTVGMLHEGILLPSLNQN